MASETKEDSDFKPAQRRVLVIDADEPKTAKSTAIEDQLAVAHGRVGNVTPVAASQKPKPGKKGASEKTLTLEGKLKPTDSFNTVLASTLGDRSEKAAAAKPPAPPRPRPIDQTAPPSAAAAMKATPGLSSTRPAANAPSVPVDLEALRSQYQIPVSKVARKLHRTRRIWLTIILLLLAAGIAALVLLRPDLLENLIFYLESLAG